MASFIVPGWSLLEIIDDFDAFAFLNYLFDVFLGSSTKVSKSKSRCLFAQRQAKNDRIAISTKSPNRNAA